MQETKESSLDQFREPKDSSSHIVYPEYKLVDSEKFESIPNSWDLRKLKQVSDIFPSNVDKKEDEEEPSIFLCNYTEVYNNSKITSDLDFMEATAKESDIEKFKLEEGDVIITKDSESWDDIGVPAYVAETMEDVICGYHLAHLKPSDSNIFGEFLYYFLESEAGSHHFHVEANGVTRYGISVNGIKETPIIVPSLEEQEGIVEFLNRETEKIDNLVDRKQKLIDLIEEKRETIIKNAVIKGLDSEVEMRESGVDWLGEVPEHWEVPRIRFVARMESGHTPSQSENEYWDGYIPWVSLADSGQMRENDYISDTDKQISEAGIANSSARILPPETMVFTRDATVGLCAITTREMAVSQHIIGWICEDNLLPEYLLNVTKAMDQELERLTMGATISTVGMEDIKKLKMPLPPIEEQKEIVEYLNGEIEKFGESVEKIQEGIERLKEYRTALITNAVTGKIDVRGEV